MSQPETVESDKPTTPGTKALAVRPEADPHSLAGRRLARNRERSWPDPPAQFPTLLDELVGCTIAETTAGKGDGQDRDREAVYAELMDEFTRLVGPDPSAIERNLAASCVLAMASMRHAEYQANQIRDRTPIVAAFEQKRLAVATARYTKLMRTLAQVRKLAIPAVQVNVGETVNAQQVVKQVNGRGGKPRPVAQSPRREALDGTTDGIDERIGRSLYGPPRASWGQVEPSPYGQHRRTVPCPPGATTP